MAQHFNITYCIDLNITKKVNYAYIEDNYLEEGFVGYRYRVECTCRVKYQDPPTDMSFLKTIFRAEIQDLCDHATIIDSQDPFLKEIISSNEYTSIINQQQNKPHFILKSSKVGKLCITPFKPSSENLAKAWYEAIREKITTHNSGPDIKFEKIKVWETNNWYTEYSANL
ncbi:6-carboxytetrahydropterin synthase [Microbulbifer sp. THAF38]|uniref:6-carboxytetrahydropterin synthase n=1 Tax=Microbulbifer sp. THAF38 TaxID=2587856 RepID=UPI0012685FC7|nr:6-carboxytetrahydropterin synthase [Microbulbifer sp. THAF38]QFT54279.1 6-pyruvoyl tetrahydropterin synthase [Microbulbifer sp. THAF38]